MSLYTPQTFAENLEQIGIPATILQEGAKPENIMALVFSGMLMQLKKLSMQRWDGKRDEDLTQTIDNLGRTANHFNIFALVNSGFVEKLTHLYSCGTCAKPTSFTDSVSYLAEHSTPETITALAQSSIAGTFSLGGYNFRSYILKELAGVDVGMVELLDETKLVDKFWPHDLNPNDTERLAQVVGNLAKNAGEANIRIMAEKNIPSIIRLRSTKLGFNEYCDFIGELGTNPKLLLVVDNYLTQIDLGVNHDNARIQALELAKNDLLLRPISVAPPVAAAAIPEHPGQQPQLH